VEAYCGCFSEDFFLEERMFISRNEPTITVRAAAAIPHWRNLIVGKDL
jgi:hypothetical protein